jgi:hypothetical protein
MMRKGYAAREHAELAGYPCACARDVRVVRALFCATIHWPAGGAPAGAGAPGVGDGEPAG